MSGFAGLKRWWRHTRNPTHRRFLEAWRAASRSEASGGRVSVDEAALLAMGRDRAESMFRFREMQQQCSPLEPNESAALTFLHPKTAAILYDRIWGGATVWQPDAPSEMLFFQKAGDIYCLQFLFDNRDEGPSQTSVAESIARNAAHHEEHLPGIVSEMEADLSRAVTPMFGVGDAYNAAYRPGNREVLVAVLDRLPFINESALEWPQVIEVRRDTTARDELRNFIHWADIDLVNMQVDEISEEIGRRFRLYEQSMQKHGIKVKLAILESAFDLRSKLFGAGLVAALSAAQLDALLVKLGAIGLVLGETSVTLTRKLVDLREKGDQLKSQHSEIAVLARLRD